MPEAKMTTREKRAHHSVLSRSARLWSLPQSALILSDDNSPCSPPCRGGYDAEPTRCANTQNAPPAPSGSSRNAVPRSSNKSLSSN